MSDPASNPPERPTPAAPNPYRVDRVEGRRRRPRHGRRRPLSTTGAVAPALARVVAACAAVAVVVAVAVALIVCGGW